jgi:hypothetical protein
MTSFCSMILLSSSSLFETVSKLFLECLETVLELFETVSLFPAFWLVQNFKTVFSEPNCL